MDNPAAFAAAARGDFVNALVAATPGGIERQEAAGQQAITESFTQIPKKGLDRPTFEKLGFAFGEDVDDLFVAVTPPTGWTLRPTEHSMHNEIVDAGGHVRGRVFYKAAFYDRRADVRLVPRFTVETQRENPDDWNSRTRAAAIDHKLGVVMQATEWTDNVPGRAGYERQNAAETGMRQWLSALYPNFGDVGHWDC